MNKQLILRGKINGVPAKSQFLQFNSQQSLAFSRLPAEKDSYCSCVINNLKNLLILPLLFSVINCYSYEIMLHSKYDTIKTRRITLPPKMWASFDTTGEEDLRKYCGKKPLLLVKFRNNSPIEVWCNED